MRTFLKIVRTTTVILAILFIALLAYMAYNAQPKHPNYELNLTLTPPAQPQLNVGFASLVANPQVPDRWIDLDQDHAFKPENGETFIDGNENGQFDPIYLGGFLKPGRVASAIHDDLMVNTVVIDDGKNRIAVVATDQTGFTHALPIEVRQMLPPHLAISFIAIHATHTHSAPDLIGLWGKNIFTSGVVGGNKEYYEYLKQQIVASVTQAVANLKPARLRFYHDPTGGSIPVNDNRPPIVKDNALRLIEAIDVQNQTTLGMIVQWSCHPITSGSQTEITGDFVHYLRQAITNGITQNGQTVEEGIHAPVLYMNGCLGGHASGAGQLYKDPYTDTIYTEAFERTKAQGELLAQALFALRKSNQFDETQNGISLRAKTLDLKIENPIFIFGLGLGLMQNGMSGWLKAQTEVSAWKIGPATFVTLPGELYPEIANGGVEAPPYADFAIAPVETPPFRETMNNKHTFVFSLVNDCVGYIIPKSQWDQKAPYTYDYIKEPYGEMVSFGPETAPMLHHAVTTLIKELE